MDIQTINHLFSKANDENGFNDFMEVIESQFEKTRLNLNQIHNKDFNYPSFCSFEIFREISNYYNTKILFNFEQEKGTSVIVETAYMKDGLGINSRDFIVNDELEDHIDIDDDDNLVEIIHKAIDVALKHNHFILEEITGISKTKYPDLFPKEW
ncbi:MAG: hypothetical protein PHQ17_08835 [Methanobacterium sp.]|nr:hypothetical protein [Methanobacterium sp.]